MSHVASQSARVLEGLLQCFLRLQDMSFHLTRYPESGCQALSIVRRGHICSRSHCGVVATSEALLLHVTDYVGNEYFRDEPLRGMAAFHVPESAMTPCP